MKLCIDGLAYFLIENKYYTGNGSEMNSDVLLKEVKEYDSILEMFLLATLD